MIRLTAIPAEWVLAVVRSRYAKPDGDKKQSPVDGPFVETKEWMGGDERPVPGRCDSFR